MAQKSLEEEGSAALGPRGAGPPPPPPGPQLLGVRRESVDGAGRAVPAKAPQSRAGSACLGPALLQPRTLDRMGPGWGVVCGQPAGSDPGAAPPGSLAEAVKGDWRGRGGRGGAAQRCSPPPSPRGEQGPARSLLSLAGGGGAPAHCGGRRPRVEGGYRPAGSRGSQSSQLCQQDPSRPLGSSPSPSSSSRGNRGHEDGRPGTHAGTGQGRARGSQPGSCLTLASFPRPAG